MNAIILNNVRLVNDDSDPGRKFVYIYNVYIYIYNVTTAYICSSRLWPQISKSLSNLDGHQYQYQHFAYI